MTDESRPPDDADINDGTRTVTSAADGRPPSLRVVTAVASVRGVHVRDLPPLASAVDPDALDAMFAPAFDGPDRDVDGFVTFEYADCDVVVHADGRVEVSVEDVA